MVAPRSLAGLGSTHVDLIRAGGRLLFLLLVVRGHGKSRAVCTSMVNSGSSRTEIVEARGHSARAPHSLQRVLSDRIRVMLVHSLGAIASAVFLSEAFDVEVPAVAQGPSSTW